MKKHYYIRWFIRFCFILVILPGESFSSNQLSVAVINGIYAPGFDTKLERKAVSHLRDGIKKIYGVELPQLASDTIEPGSNLLITLGRKGALQNGQLTESALTHVYPDGFIIQSDNNGVVIAGNDSWSILMGVYRFLEECGMRFYQPWFSKAEVIESRSGLLPNLNIVSLPSFAYRPGRSSVWKQMFYQLGNPKNGLDPDLFDRKTTGSDLWIDHTAGYLVPKAMFYDTHPEYYALVSGKRIEYERFTDHRTPLCLSNQEVGSISKERALGWIEKEKEKRFFMITYGDTGVWCQCTPCSKLDEYRGIYSDRLLSWVNPIARAVRKKYPEKILLTFAYSETSVPPAREKPEKNVWVVGSTGLGGIPFWDHAMAQKKISEHHLAKIDGWQKVAPNQFAVCEYQSKQYKPAVVDTLLSRLQYYHSKGVKGIAFTYGTPINFNNLWQYLYGRLSWDVNQDAMNLAHNFINNYYKESAPHIWNIISLSHKRYTDTLRDGVTLKDNYPKGFYSNQFAASLSLSFYNAAEALRHDRDLQKEIQMEETYFIFDWMRQPSYTKLDGESLRLLKKQMERLLALLGESEKERVEFARELHRLAIGMDKTHQGTQKVIEDWILTQNLHKPIYEKHENGILLWPESFRFSGFGPAIYKYHSPPMPAVGVYVKGNSKDRSHRMVAEFELEASRWNRKTSKLKLTGQVSTSGLLKPKIRIVVNDREIYSGSADFVENNWSLQSYTIPAGVLHAGLNSIEIENISNPLSIIRWNQRWCLISRAEIINKN